MSRLIKKVKEDFVEVTMILISWALLFLSEIRINFLIVFIVTLFAYILASIIRTLIWQKNNK